MRAAISRYFVSRSPTTNVTGISRLPRRDHSDGSVPVPSPRNAAARPDGSFRRRSASATPLTEAGWSASTQVSAQRSANFSIVSFSARAASFSSAARRSARAVAVFRPGLAPISTSRWTRSGSRNAACSAIRPPIEYPTSMNGSGAARSTSSITACSVTGRCAEAWPWPRMSGANASVSSGRASITPSQLRPVLVNPWSRTTLGVMVIDHARSARKYSCRPQDGRPSGAATELGSPAMSTVTDTHLLLRALCDEFAPLWPGARVHLAGLALLADRDLAGRASRGSAAGRTSTSAAPASSRVGAAKASGRPVAVTCTSGHGGRQPRAGRDRGRSRPGSRCSC